MNASCASPGLNCSSFPFTCDLGLSLFSKDILATDSPCKSHDSYGTVSPTGHSVPILTPSMPVNTDFFQLHTFSSNAPALSPVREVEEPARTPSSPNSGSVPFKCHAPFTAPWITARLRDDPNRAIPLLRNWSHSKRF